MDGDCAASWVKLFYLGILYCFFTEKNILSRNLCRFIKGIHKLQPILSLHRCNAGKLFSVFSIASSGKTILANKILSLYSIFLKNRYTFEYPCPPMQGSQSSSGIPRFVSQ
jgi:hypothetical protein